MDREAWQKRNATGASRSWLDRDAAAYMRQSGSTPCITAIRRAGGAWLEDHAGKRYIDLHGNSVHHIGYGHPRLIEALTKQLEELPFTPRRFTDEPAVLLAETLAKHWPGGKGKVLLTTGGSDAIEVAMKIARAATGRYKTISFYDSYHGSGFGALSVGGRYSDRSPRLGPLLEGALHVPPFYRRPAGGNGASGGDEAVDSPRWAEASLDAMHFVFERERDIAAVIAEPIRSAPHLPPDWYWPEVRSLCDRHETLLIFDEVPTGLGKTGKLFASEHVGAQPDITVLGKALGGGVVPIAAVIARAELDLAPELTLGHYTHEKNPFTARAALTTLEIILEENLTERAARLGERALARMQQIAGRQKLVRSFRGRGCLFAIELHSGARFGRTDDSPAESAAWRALDKGVNLSAGEGRDLSMTAPLVISEAELDRALDLVEEAIAEEWAEIGPKGN
jgi:4-aminobutyrate aminotransferase